LKRIVTFQCEWQKLPGKDSNNRPILIKYSIIEYNIVNVNNGINSSLKMLKFANMVSRGGCCISEDVRFFSFNCHLIVFIALTAS
jgi:hypothetical protein